jgi:hypothetical protein
MNLEINIYLKRIKKMRGKATLKYIYKLLSFLQIAEIETGMAEKSRWDQANGRQKHGLVWRNRKKINQIIKDYFYLPFFLLIIL